MPFTDESFDAAFMLHVGMNIASKDELFAEVWCEGFLLGTSLTEEAWTPLVVEHTDWFEPFMRLGTNEGLAITDQEDDAELMMNAVEPALELIHAFWRGRPHPALRPGAANGF
jgi:hypothetical protein